MTDHKGEDGSIHLLPQKTPLFVVQAHNEARRANAAIRFFFEFKSLAEKEGHEVVEKTRLYDPRKNSPCEDISETAKQLVTLPDIEESQFAHLHDKIIRNEATSLDKWLCFKHQYKASWGINTVSGDFVDENGTNIGDGKVHGCMRFLFPDMFVKDYAAPSESEFMLQLSVINAVLAAVGWRHPFDSTPVCLTNIKDSLLQIDFFRNFNTSIRLFRARYKLHDGKWETKQITDALSVVLGTIGVKFTSSQKRYRLADEKRLRVQTYHIDPDYARRMAALVNLKRRGAVSVNPEAQRFLEEVGYGKWAPLVNDGLDMNDACNVYFDDQYDDL